MTTKSQEAYHEFISENFISTKAEVFEAGAAYGRKQALEEAVEICESTKQGGINGHMAATRCANQIKALIK
jgi:hypothetical protein